MIGHGRIITKSAERTQMMESSEAAAQMVCCLQGGRPGAKPLLKCTAGHICAEAYSDAPDHMGPADHALTGARMTSGRTSLPPNNTE